MATCLIGLGSNLGDRAELLRAAIAKISKTSGVSLRKQSQFLETAAVGGPVGQGAFLNAAVVVDTMLLPVELLAELKNIETDLGRSRRERWGPRMIDLDLLLVEGVAVNTAALVLPHPRMAFRRFVLAPAAEIAPELRHPIIGWTMRQLLEHLDTAQNYVAITGGNPMMRRAISSLVAVRAGARLLAAAVGDDDLTRWLERATALIEVDAWPMPNSWAISDFWFDEILVRARQTLAPAAFVEFEAAWRTAKSRVVSPKLLVVVDASDDSTESLPLSAALLRQQSSQPEIGPVLHLDSADLPRAVEEVAAAIQAM